MSALNGLTPKQKAFAIEFPKDFNGTQAAKRAGYSGDENSLAVTANRLLRNAKIASYIQAQLEARVMESDELLYRYREKARFDVSEYLTPISDDTDVSKNDGWAIDIEKLKADGKGHLIREIVNTRSGQNIKLANPDDAQQLIGKHLGLFNDRIENLNIDLSKLTNEQLKRLASGESPLDVMADPGTS